MTATDLQVGQTIKLNYDNKDVVFKILIKTSENQFKLFNKYYISFFANIDFINENLINN